MKVISLNGNSKVRLKNSCAAIGIFDGVHRGHQYLIKKMVAASRRLKAQPIVITFFPHPAHVIRPDMKLGYLSSLEERYRLLDELGVDICIVVPFNKSFASIQPEKFIKEMLVDKLGVKAVFVGKDFRFGKDRSGDISLFQKLSSTYGYEMHPVEAVKQGDAVISSTRIRQLVMAGKFKEAAKLLGRNVSVSGTVVRGAGRGRQLGFPTANIQYEEDILPPQGVYVVKAVLGKNEFGAVANIGTRPSFDNQITKLYLEVHIFDFKRNIYGKKLKVEFLKKLRSEKKFTGPQQLIKQIQKDVVKAKKYFAV